MNAIDRVESLKEKYDRRLNELNAEIPKLEQLTAKPFLQEAELQSMKTELSGMERQIAIKIQEKQLSQHRGENVEIDNVTEKTKPVIQMIPEKSVAVNDRVFLKEIVTPSQTEIQRVRNRMRL